MERSFSKIQRTVVHEMRRRISECASVSELSGAFAEIGDMLMAAVFDKSGVEIPRASIAFSASGKSHYQMSKKLREDEDFMFVWQSSDLPAIIDRFADSAYHHYLHLKKTPARANIKIRH